MSVGCKVTGQVRVRRHGHYRCQVCWGGNCQWGRPAASGAERDSAGEKMRSSLWWSLSAWGGRLNIWRRLFMWFPLVPFAQLCILLTVPLSACFACCLCLTPAHVRFPLPSIFPHCFSNYSRHLSLCPLPLVLGLPPSHQAFTQKLQKHHSLIPQQFSSNRHQETCVYLLCLLTDSR